MNDLTYNFNSSTNKYTDKLPAYIYKYDKVVTTSEASATYGLCTFIRYLTNYLITAETAMNEICDNSTLSVYGDNGNTIGAQGDLLKKLGYKIDTEVPTGLSSENARTVIKGTVLNRSSTGAGKVLKEVIIGLFGGYFTDADIEIEDIGAESIVPSMSYSVKINKAFSGVEEKKIVQQYLVPSFMGINGELQTVSGEVFSFDKNEPLDPNAPTGSIGHLGWDLGSWAEIYI